MSGKCSIKNDKLTVNSKLMSAKPMNEDDHGNHGHKSACKSVRNYDPYPTQDLNLGTVYKAVEERRIVIALSVIPIEFFKTLCNHGWMLKTNVPNSKYTNKTLGSLYPNVNLARTMAEKHDAGLIWTNDVYSGKVPWSTLKPWVVVNRFPRNGCPEIKLCGHGMVGKPEYDGYHPRTYKNTTVDSGFMEDFALTACVSLLRMFADKIVKCKESGKVRVYQTIFRL